MRVNCQLKRFLSFSAFDVLKTIFLRVLLLCSVWQGAAYAQEDISVIQDGYEVFYSAFNTSFISPDVASAAGIVRGKNKGLVNISIVRYNTDGERFPVAAKLVNGTAYDLIYRKALVFKSIVEPGARYYLAPFDVSANNEFIQFDISVLPEGAKQAIPVSFKRRFYKD